MADLYLFLCLKEQTRWYGFTVSKGEISLYFHRIATGAKVTRKPNKFIGNSLNHRILISIPNLSPWKLDKKLLTRKCIVKNVKYLDQRISRYCAREIINVDNLYFVASKIPLLR